MRANRYKRWTEEDHEFLMRAYGGQSTKSIANTLDRTCNSIRRRASVYGLRKKPCRRVCTMWHWQRSLLIEVGSQFTVNELQPLLWMSPKDIRYWARELGISPLEVSNAGRSEDAEA